MYYKTRHSEVLDFWIRYEKNTCLVNFIDGLIEKNGKVCVGCVSDTSLVFFNKNILKHDKCYILGWTHEIKLVWINGNEFWRKKYFG